MSTLQERFDQASAILKEHNDVLTVYPSDVAPPGYVRSDDFINRLKAIGGTSAERLDRLTAEDLLLLLPDVNGTRPILLAKALIKVLRNPTPEDNKGGGVITAKKAERMTPQELIAAYDPTDPDNAVAKRLASMSKNQPFVVFDMGGAVNVGRSFELLQELRQGFPPRKLVKVDSEQLPVYAVGVRPDLFVDENPLYPGRPLRPDGTCDQTNRSFEGVPLRARQLIRIAMNLGFIKVTLDRAHDILDMAVSLDAETKLATRYPEAAVKYRELENIGDLPKLKVKLTPGGAPARPFDNGKKVRSVPKKAMLTNVGGWRANSGPIAGGWIYVQSGDTNSWAYR